MPVRRHPKLFGLCSVKIAAVLMRTESNPYNNSSDIALFDTNYSISEAIAGLDKIKSRPNSSPYMSSYITMSLYLILQTGNYSIKIPQNPIPGSHIMFRISPGSPIHIICLQLGPVPARLSSLDPFQSRSTTVFPVCQLVGHVFNVSRSEPICPLR
jgi:hypothetical protein